MGGANQNVEGVTGDTTVVVATGDVAVASVSHTHPVPNQQPVDVTGPRAPIHQGKLDDGVAVVNDA